MKTENSDFACIHYFGYLSQLKGVEKTPEECLICKKLIECKYAKSDIVDHRESSEVTQSVEVPIVDSAKEELEKTNDEVTQSVEVPIVDSAKEELEKTNELEDESSSVNFSGNMYVVSARAKLRKLIKRRPETVFINNETLSGWGVRVSEVDVKTKTGKQMRCKIMASKKVEKGLILVPEKIQEKLEIKQGEQVTVEPSIMLVLENKSRDILSGLFNRF